MKVLILLTELVLIFGLLKYIFEIKWVEITYSVEESNEYLGLKPTDEPKYLSHKTKVILGVEYMLSFIGNGSDSIGFDTYEEAREQLKLIKDGKV